VQRAQERRQKRAAQRALSCNLCTRPSREAPGNLEAKIMKFQYVFGAMLALAACAADKKQGDTDDKDNAANAVDAGTSSTDGHGADDDASTADTDESDASDNATSEDGGAAQDGGDRRADAASPGVSAEVCDGVDNDHDGITDNVDAEKDGVCDCLNIATIGDIGPWSNGGNVFKTWLSMRSPTGAVALGDQVLTDELLKPFQVIVVLHVGNQKVEQGGRTALPEHNFSADEAAALERWVRRGGGLMTTIGYELDQTGEIRNANRLLVPLGVAYSTTKKVEGFVPQWQMHPVTDGVKRVFTEHGAQPDGAQGTTLAHDEGGGVALQVIQADTGRVVVWGDEWITYDSEWADTTDKQVDRFWLNILKWLSPPKVCQVAIPVLL
jgi:hypothetical protein